MRRILRKIAEDEFGNLGDTSTLADPAVVDDLVNNRQNKNKRMSAKLLRLPGTREVKFPWCAGSTVRKKISENFTLLPPRC